MKLRIGFIGAGNMASALINGMMDGGVEPAMLSAFDIDKNRLKSVSAAGVMAFDSLADIAAHADCLVLAVKPKDCNDVLSALGGLKWNGALVSIVMGWQQEKLMSALPTAKGILRMMPNTPSQVGEGVIAINQNHSMDSNPLDAIKACFRKCGLVIEIPENLFDAVTSISGSGPAYVYLFIEAFADAAVREGLSRPIAYMLSAQTLRGAAAMVQKTGKHPAALKDDVCSPGGTTIEAVAALEKAGLRNAIMDAVHACADKARRVTEQMEGKSK